MPLDPNIILGAQQPQIQNPLDAMSKVMAYKNLAARSQTDQLQAQQAQQDFSDNQAMRQAKSNHTTVDNNGQVSVDRSGMLNDLAKSSPSLVMQAQQNFAQQDAAIQKQTIEKQRDLASYGAQVLGSARDQASYDNARKQALAVGGNVSQWPAQYDPNWVKSAQYAAMDAHQQLTTKISETEAQNKKMELAMEYHKTYGGNMPGMPTPSYGIQGGGSSSAPADPSTLVPQNVPQSQQAKALEEIKDNQNIAKIAGPSLAAFDQAAKEVRPFTGLTKTSGTAFIPHIPFVGDMESSGQKAFSGAANTTVKDVEGTARQAAFDSLKDNFRPQFGDSDETIALKRKGWINYLASHSAAPTNKAYGIDLKQFPSTSFDPNTVSSPEQKAASTPPPEGATKIWKGQTYKIVGNHWVAQ